MFAPTTDMLAWETTAVLWFSTKLLHSEFIGVEIADDRQLQIIAVSDTRDVTARVCQCWVEILRRCGSYACGENSAKLDNPSENHRGSLGKEVGLSSIYLCCDWLIYSGMLSKGLLLAERTQRFEGRMKMPDHDDAE